MSYVTTRDLSRLRDALASVQGSITALADAREPVPPELDLLAVDLAARKVAVVVPCVICRTPYPVVVGVGDEPPSWPRCVLCGPCDGRATDDDATAVLVEEP
jgi:hypothetical protein